MIEPNAIAILRATPAMVTALLAPFDEAALSQPADEGWSVLHITAHILDVDQVIFDDRIQRILSEDCPFIRSIDPTARMEQRGLLGRNVAGLVAELLATRPERVEAIVVLTPVQLARAGDHDAAGEITVSDLIHQWAYHDLMHLKQAATILQAPLAASMGNTRKFYDL
jgi:hypothetical protein